MIKGLFISWGVYKCPIRKVFSYYMVDSVGRYYTSHSWCHGKGNWIQCSSKGDSWGAPEVLVDNPEDPNSYHKWFKENIENELEIYEFMEEKDGRSDVMGHYSQFGYINRAVSYEYVGPESPGQMWHYSNFGYDPRFFKCTKDKEQYVPNTPEYSDEEYALWETEINKNFPEVVQFHQRSVAAAKLKHKSRLARERAQDRKKIREQTQGLCVIDIV